MSKRYYKIKGTNDYGVLEVQVWSNHSSYLQLRLVNAVGGMIELSHQYEDVTIENLVQVSPEEVQKFFNLKADDSVICSIENGKIVIEPVYQKVSKYTLDELLAGEIEPGEEISWGKPEGEEFW